MPPSGRKGKTRARRAPATEVHEPSDAETPDAIATPTRSSRKRTRGTDNSAPASRNTRRKLKDTRAADREDTEGTEAQDQSDADTEVAIPGEAEVIAHLRVADRQVNATEDFANDLLEGQENVPGYGKIAGRDWAFIIRKVEINIGRPEAQERLPMDDGTGQGGPAGATAKAIVDIDLGPDRQVSRSHAIISYDGDNSKWVISVNGRNGLRVDNNLLKRGSQCYLRNGSVIEIANTQMAFITTPTEAGEEPVFDASIMRQAQKSSEEDDEGDDDRGTHGFRQQGHPTARSQLSNSAMYGGDQNGQQRRAHPHSGQTQFGAPGTPMRAPSAFMKSSPAANYARGVMMESTETIDYSAESAKDLKPPHSYAQLIGMAILSTTEQQMTLNNIYKWIMANYAFYRFNTGGWQNSIRHNLSLNKAFTKIARRTDEPGKGMKWMIEPTEFDTFVQQGMKGCRRPNPMPGTQSTLGSPHSPMIMKPANGLKRDDDATPPLNSYRPMYPTAAEAYTPERGPKRALDGPILGLGIDGNNVTSAANVNPEGPEYDYLTRSTPRNKNNNLTAMGHAAGSPPALFIRDDNRVAGGLDTPFPLRPTQRLAPPSTLRRPSDFIQFSSPAPFWKMEGLVGSTPFRAFDLSPVKTPFPDLKKEAEAKEKAKEDAAQKGAESEQDGDAAENGESEDAEKDAPRSPVIHSSSPPVLRRNSDEDDDALTASPTLSRPATAVAKTLSQLATAAAADNEAEEVESMSPTVNGRSRASSSLWATQAAYAVPTTATNAAPASSSSNGNGYSTYGGYNNNGTNGLSSSSYGHPQANAGPNGNGYHQPQPHAQHHHHHHSQHPQQHPHEIDDGAGEEGIDLAKGFQSIGSFHQRNHLAMSLGMAAGGGTPGGFGR